MKYLIIIGLAVSSLAGQAQVESASLDMRPWYSTYINKRINHRWSADMFGLVAMRSMDNDFWLTQVNVGMNYRINRFWTFYFGYGHARYKYTGAWWDRHYPDLEPGIFNTVGFNSVNLSLKRLDPIGRNFSMSNRFIVQKYFPRFEKYGTRLQYALRFDYRRRNLPLAFRPFVQGAIFYYLDGVPANYYDEDFEVVDFASPDGLHRYRVRIGFRVNPIPSNRRLNMVFYWGYNREFNGSGNDLNFERPSASGRRTFITYPFNNYSILGVQLNLFLR
ncbi:MAG: hypothetical protein AAGC88_08730 [Bacteroidota bacterium]